MQPVTTSKQDPCRRVGTSDLDSERVDLEAKLRSGDVNEYQTWLIQTQSEKLLSK